MAAEGGLRHLYPGYFALAMATGVVSTVLRQLGLPTASRALLVIDIGCFVTLVAIYGARLARYPRDVRVDFASPERSFAFFTFVAACNVLGTRLAATGDRTVTVSLAIVAGVAWLLLCYSVPAQLILAPRQRALLAGVNGSWFIWVVGTQSLAVVSAVLQRHQPHSSQPAVALAATAMWAVGVMLYVVVVAVVFLRLLLVEVTAADLTPSYWVAMGATAISVLAAAELLSMQPTPITRATRPFVTGLAVLLWAFGSWLVPLLAVFSVWRYRRLGHWTYEPPLWSVVFPLGMYAAASLEIGKVARLPLVENVGHVAAWVAVTTWTVVFVAMVWHYAGTSGRTMLATFTIGQRSDHAANQPRTP